MTASLPEPASGGLALHQLVGHGEEFPLVGYALERVHAAIGEGEARTGDEVSDRARNQDLAGLRKRCDACRDVHCDAADIVVDELALARVHTRPGFETKAPRLGHDCLGASDCSRRSVEGGKEPVARRLDLTPAESLELTTHLRLM
jgi:hypothetical protein